MIRSVLSYALLGLCLLLFNSPTLVRGQEVGAPQQLANQQPKVKEYGAEGVPKMTVFVWGNADSGVWRVEKGTDLLEFLSVVSRLRMRDRNPDRRLVKTLSMYRDGNPTQGEPFFQARVEELFTGRNNYPELQEGDVLVLETEAQNRFTWRDIAQVAGTVATVLNTFLIIQRIR